jgi:hypothetical protein
VSGTIAGGAVKPHPQLKRPSKNADAEIVTPPAMKTLGTVSNLLLDRLIRLVRQNWAIVRGQIGDRREQNGDRSDEGGDRSDVCSRKR